MISRPNGIVLVTGPTGSGKTTTLYACINTINTMNRNIATLEDPVEYYVATVRQTQVDPDIGLTFARGLRALLRQDPDVILVGEIRDSDTAEIAVRSALTGHLVFSTLHTNDAVGAIPRLFDMTIAPYLLASALNGVVAQRLVRRICEKCRRPVTPPDELLASLGLTPGEGTYFEAVGCRACGNTGYKGRIGIYEVFDISEEIRSLIAAHAPMEELARAARRGGMALLSEDAARKASRGQTTLEEALRVTVWTLEMPLSSKAFVGLMAAGLMAAMAQFVLYLAATGVDNPSTWFAVLGPLREVALGLLLSGIVLALFTIGTVLGFQFDRMRTLVRGEER